jgi:hypothetical protein
MNALAQQTYEYAVDHASDETSDGWLIWRGGIDPWWRGMVGDDFKRMTGLRQDVGAFLQDRGLVLQP